MGADRSHNRLAAMLCLAGLLLAVATSALAASASLAAHRAKHPAALGSSCNHPLMTTAFGGTGAGYYTVTFQVDTPSKGREELNVAVHNPRVVICRAVVEERAGRYSPTVLRTFHPTIGPHGGLSSPLPSPQAGTSTILFAKVYARLEPAKRPAPGTCSRKTWWLQPNAQLGDTKDFGVKLKGAEEPGPLEVEVAVHNPRIIICSATISVLEGIEGGEYREVTFPVTISSHGGLSSKVTLPAAGHFYAPKATVLARLK